MQTDREKYEEQNVLQEGSEHDPFTLERYAQFYRFFPSGSRRALDVGCNTGRGGLRLKQLDAGLNLTGLDCVADRLALLPSAYDHRILGLSTRIDQEDAWFDVVVAGEFLEHVYPADVDPTLCEFQRVLRVGGRLLMTTPNPYYLKSRFRNETIYSVGHLTQHYPELLCQRLKMHGFSNIRLLGSGKMTRYLGSRFPWLSVYGSYLVLADKW